MSAVLDYLKESGVFYLSTMDGNQRVYVRSALYANLKANCILLPQKTKNVYKQLLENPRVEFLP